MESHYEITTGKQYKKGGQKPKRKQRAARDCRTRVYKESKLIRYEISLENTAAEFVTACLKRIRKRQKLSRAAQERLDTLPAYWRDCLKGKQVGWKTS